MRSVSSICLICDISVKSEEVIYITGAKTENATNWRGKPILNVLFQGKRNPRGVIHRHCWERIAKEVKEEKNIKPIHINRRLESVE